MIYIRCACLLRAVRDEIIGAAKQLLLGAVENLSKLYLLCAVYDLDLGQRMAGLAELVQADKQVMVGLVN